MSLDCTHTTSACILCRMALTKNEDTTVHQETLTTDFTPQPVSLTPLLFFQNDVKVWNTASVSNVSAAVLR